MSWEFTDFYNEDDDDNYEDFIDEDEEFRIDYGEFEFDLSDEDEDNWEDEGGAVLAKI